MGLLPPYHPGPGKLFPAIRAFEIAPGIIFFNAFYKTFDKMPFPDFVIFVKQGIAIGAVNSFCSDKLL